VTTLPLGARVRLWTWAAALRPLKHVLPLEWLIAAARARKRQPRSVELEAALSAYLAARGRFPGRPPSNCLERSLGAYRLLCTWGAGPELVIGFRRESGALRGHVWVAVDGRPFGEPVEAMDHLTVARFDAEGRRHASPGAPPIQDLHL
jgi:hypothetical protein